MVYDMAPVIIISAAVLVSAVILAAFFSTARTRKKLEYMLDALEDGETNFRFSEHRVFDRKLNRSLNRIKSIFDREKAVVMEQERYYGLMLDNVRTGIIVADASDGRVSYTNARALELLGVSGIVNMRQLRRMDSGLYEAFLRVEEGHDDRDRTDDQRDQGESQRVALLRGPVGHIHPPVALLAEERVGGVIVSALGAFHNHGTVGVRS